jgi:hypothetical protein
MLVEKIMRELVPCVGDVVAFKGQKYTVESHFPNGRFLSHIRGLAPEIRQCESTLLLVTDTAGAVDYIPLAECRILRSNPQYAMERLLAYLDKKQAIDWDQLDAEHPLGD